MSRALDDLSPRMRPLAIELLARCVEAGIPVMIVDTLRTPAEHAANLAAGTSRVKHSKHLDGDAIDIAPFEQYFAHGGNKLMWDTDSAVAVRTWRKLGAIGEALGLRWGGRFKPLSIRALGWDPGHFEFQADSVAPAAPAGPGSTNV
jgi:hypothetical protein